MSWKINGQEKYWSGNVRSEGPQVIWENGTKGWRIIKSSGYSRSSRPYIMRSDGVKYFEEKNMMESL